jgi:cytochrome c-type biogenesis protein CcmF
MIIGILAIWIATGAIVAALFGYIKAARGSALGARGATTAQAKGKAKRYAPAPAERRAPSAERASEASLRFARRAFVVSAASAFVAAVVLMTLVVGRHYEVAYIFEHSGNDLPLQYRVASFWAGQEGTFLLWTLYGSVLGLMLIRRARDYERWVMPFFCGIQLFLLAILCIMSPFRLHDLGEMAKMGVLPPSFAVPQTFWAKTLYFFGLGELFRPANGTGLNISLQNMWMVIHPPIIFTGFAALSVPGCFALAALARRDYDGWVNRAASWTIFGWMAIGFGKFLGGYWAYETLGWGGFWAWDPVENTSIVPWIFGLALIHGMLVQRARGSLKQANLFLAILTFLAVLYGTFLTRSGVLGEFSVHSFTAPAYAVYVMMLGFMALWAVGGFGLLAARFKEIRSESAYDRLNERPFGFFLAVILVIGAGAVVTIGMSWPIISPRLIGHAASLKFDFYNRAMIPIATFMCLLMAITPFMPWRKASGGRSAASRPAKPLQKAVTICAGLILLCGIPAAALAWHGGSVEIQRWLATAFRIPDSLLKPDTGFSPAAIPALLVFFAAACLGLFANSVMFARTIRGGLLQTGAWVSHIAICIGFVGIVITSVFSSTRELVLSRGETGEAHGYRFRYAGLQVARPPEQNYLAFDVSRGSERFSARLPYFQNPNGGEMQIVTRPSIHKFWSHDIYSAAGGWSNGSEAVDVQQGQTATTKLGYQITLKGFQHSGLPGKAGGAMTSPLVVRPVLEVRAPGTTATVTPAYTIRRDDRVEQEQVALPGGAHRVIVEQIRVPQGSEEAPGVKLMLTPVQPIDMVMLEVTYKPFINLVWLAGYLLLFGAFLGFRRRAKLAAREAHPPARPGAGRPLQDAPDADEEFPVLQPLAEPLPSPTRGRTEEEIEPEPEREPAIAGKQLAAGLDFTAETQRTQRRTLIEKLFSAISAPLAKRAVRSDLRQERPAPGA